MTLDEKLDLILTNMADMKADICSMKADICSMKADICSMKADISELKADMKDVKLRLTKVETALENETDRNIKIIAEGHLDLVRKLDYAMKATQENEMLRIRVNILEKDLRQLKEQVEQTA